MQEMQRHNDREERWGRWEYQHFPQTYKITKNYNIATKITIYSLIVHRKINFHVLHFWQRQQTRHNSWTLSFQKLSTYEVVNTTRGGRSYGLFSWTRWTRPHLKEPNDVWMCAVKKAVKKITTTLTDATYITPTGWRDNVQFSDKVYLKRNPKLHSCILDSILNM